MSNEFFDLVKSQRNFYRDHYQRGCKMLAVLLVIILLLTVALVFVYMRQPQLDFYATSFDGKLVPLNALNAPNYSSTPLIE